MGNFAAFFLAVVLGAIAPLALSAQQTQMFGPADIGGSPTSVVRIDASSENATIEESRLADRALMQAIATNDQLAAGRLLASEFAWIDRDGRSRSKSEMVDYIGLLSAGPDANVAVRAYGRLALVTGTHPLTPDGAEAFFTRVWVRQASNWRLLLYQETAPGDFSVKAPSPEAARPQWTEACDNPCSSLPYKPLSSDAEEIVASFMAGEKALFDGDADAAGRILGDDALFITPDGDEPVSKTERLAAMRNVRHAEQAVPPEVASMAVWVYGEAAVMSADQDSRYGELLRTTRIWAKRDAGWQLIFSQQTEVR